MTTYLNVQRAARRLGVSPVTIRRWTATGFLPCTRTAGGHRRIAVEDIDELARAIGDSTHLAARRARERELDTLVATSVAVAGRLETAELLAEIARQLTRLLDSHFCAVSEYDEERREVRTLAEYDAGGARLPDTDTYNLARFPLTARVIDKQMTVTVNVDDPGADPAEVATLRKDGDRSLLMMPLIDRGVTVGLIEVTDKLRARRYTRQELRLAQAVAAQAAIALRNARLLADARRRSETADRLQAAVATVAEGASALIGAPDAQTLLDSAARLALRVSTAMTVVMGGAGRTAGAAHDPAPSDTRDERELRLLVVSDPAGETDLTLTAALPAGDQRGDEAALGLVAALASARLGALTSP